MQLQARGYALLEVLFRKKIDSVTAHLEYQLQNEGQNGI